MVGSTRSTGWFPPNLASAGIPIRCCGLRDLPKEPAGSPPWSSGCGMSKAEARFLDHFGGRRADVAVKDTAFDRTLPPWQGRADDGPQLELATVRAKARTTRR